MAIWDPKVLIKYSICQVYTPRISEPWGQLWYPYCTIPHQLNLNGLIITPLSWQKFSTWGKFFKDFKKLKKTLAHSHSTYLSVYLAISIRMHQIKIKLSFSLLLDALIFSWGSLCDLFDWNPPFDCVIHSCLQWTLVKKIVDHTIMAYIF